MLDRGAGGRRLIAMMQGLLRGSTIAGAALRGRLRLLPLAVAVLVFGLVSAQVPLGAAPPPEPRQGHVDPETVMGDPAQARLDYIENCGGCHGVNGDTVPAHLPELQGRVGWFMCTPEARAYLLRLPNVAHSRIKDNAELADLMNFVIFVLGEGSVPAGTKPFTAAEVESERKHALTNMNLTTERLRLAKQVVEQCHAPASIKLLYPGSRANLPNTASVE